MRTAGAILALLVTAGGVSAQAHVGDPQLGRQVPSPASVTTVTRGDLPANALVVQCASGVLALETTQTLGTDQVGVSSWCYRGPGSWAPLYGANVGVVFATPGQVRAMELDVNNWGEDAGPARYGEHVGLWINRSGPYHNSSAIEVSTQDERGWHYGIHFDAGPEGEPSLGTGIRFDRSNREDFIIMRPFDDVDGDAVLLTDAAYTQTKAVIRKRGAFGGSSFYFTADPGTEVYQPAPGQLGVRLNGVERFKLTDTALVFDGRVGLTTCVGGLTFTGGLLTDTGGCP